MSLHLCKLCSSRGGDFTTNCECSDICLLGQKTVMGLQYNADLRNSSMELKASELSKVDVYVVPSTNITPGLS
ncbi:hypothetical protein KIN20_025539 [Parelaphostrongylus tenuis]|uniref:Uncharacterized protein n=1 Tax=Parelaphostrongylus tenuis TaxID=148309 RepID=A0AAD5NBY1_PARTN|nr:hypothetical protein KIN20_025539 [Parelaphostrongylus tenuis]